LLIICNERAVGNAIDLGAPQLRRLDCSAITQLRARAAEAAAEAAANVDPRTCPSTSAGACIYWRWFRRSDMQQQAQRQHRNSLFSLPASAKKVN